MSRYYYGSDYTNVLTSETEISVEVNTRTARYNATFNGSNATKQAIAFQNSILSIIGKDEIMELRVSTTLHIPDDEDGG